ncbi:OsmC family protein [Candidatus Neomarinimicrobiota bacterium]
MSGVEVRQLDGSTFVGRGPSNHWVVMDTKEDNGGHQAGSTPMELVLMAFGGCTGIDIDLMLKKMRVKFDDFRVTFESERADEPPRVYTKIHTQYHFWGNALPLAKLEKAVALSKEKYCSVSNSLDPNIEITTEVVVHES